ncbi:MAG: nucleoside deaminase [Rikenellaceae bacterium]
MENNKFMQMAIDISLRSVNEGGGPFGAVVVKDGVVVSKESNSVTLTNDPTAHAEVNAIRKACGALETFSLKGCILYSSCEPCPMCLSAAYWAGISKIYYGNSRADAQEINFDDSFIYDQIPLNPAMRSIPSEQLLKEEAIKAFKLWDMKEDKIAY